MLFEQNIASSVNHKHEIVRNHVEPRGATGIYSEPRRTTRNHAKPHKIINHAEPIRTTLWNLLNLKKHEIFDFKKNLMEERKKKRKKNKVGFRFASNN